VKKDTSIALGADGAAVWHQSVLSFLGGGQVGQFGRVEIIRRATYDASSVQSLQGNITCVLLRRCGRNVGRSRDNEI
jgi:hypothetical protein